METISREELLEQYDRFIDQVRTEIKDLYWLYNFFFFVDSALLGSIFFGKINNSFAFLVEITGILLSCYWLIVMRKQYHWRNEWVRKIQYLEERLGYEKDMQMWKTKRPPQNFWKQYMVGKHGLWKWLMILPLGFIIIWISVMGS